MIFKRLDKLVSLNSAFRWVPLIGIVLTIISRSMDSLENFWVILIYSNPENYAEWLLPLTRYTSFIKWGFVGLEYICVLIGIILIVAAKLLKNPKT